MSWREPEKTLHKQKKATSTRAEQVKHTRKHAEGSSETHKKHFFRVFNATRTRFPSLLATINTGKTRQDAWDSNRLHHHTSSRRSHCPQPAAAHQLEGRDSTTLCASAVTKFAVQPARTSKWQLSLSVCCSAFDVVCQSFFVVRHHPCIKKITNIRLLITVLLLRISSCPAFSRTIIVHNLHKLSLVRWI